MQHFQKSPVRLRYICSSIDPNWQLRKNDDKFFDGEILDWFRPIKDERFDMFNGQTVFRGTEIVPWNSAGTEIVPWNSAWMPSDHDCGTIREFIFEFCIVIAKDYEGEN